MQQQLFPSKYGRIEGVTQDLPMGVLVIEPYLRGLALELPVCGVGPANGTRQRVRGLAVP